MKFTRKTLLGLFGLCLAGGAATPGLAAEPLKIGFSESKTGLYAAASAIQVNSYELWKDQVNADGGIMVDGVKRPVEFVTYDDQSNPALAAQIYEKLITSDKVDLLFSPFGTPSHFAVVPMLLRYKFPMVGSSAASMRLKTLAPGYIWFPTSEFPDAVAASIVSVLQAQHYKTAAVIAVQLPFSLELEKYILPDLAKAGIKLVAKSDYPDDIKDLTPTLETVKAAAPDAVIGLTFPEDSMLYMQQAREVGISAPFQFLSVGPTYDFFTKRFGADANGIVTMGQWSPHEAAWPLGAQFYKAYIAKFGTKPEYLDGALAYMSAEITQEAVEKVGLDHAALKHEFETDTFQTIAGPIAFNGVENATTPAILMQIQNGEAQIISPASLVTSAFQPKGPWSK